MKTIIALFLSPAMAALLPLAGYCQNITDLEVANDKSADKVKVETAAPEIPDSVFLHPDRIKYDSRCFQLDGKDRLLHTLLLAQPGGRKSCCHKPEAHGKRQQHLGNKT